MGDIYLAPKAEGPTHGWYFVCEEMGLGTITPTELDRPKYEGMGRVAIDVTFLAPPHSVRPFAHEFASGEGYLYRDEALCSPDALRKMIQNAADAYQLATS